MSFTPVQTFNGAVSSANSAQATAGSAVTPGNLLVVSVTAFFGLSDPAGINLVISDNGVSGGNVWQGSNANATTQVFPTTADQITYNVWWSVIANNPASGNLVVTATAPSGVNTYISLSVSEYSGSGSIQSLSAAGVGAAGNGGTPAPGNVVVSGNDIVIGMFVQINLATATLWTPGAGYTAAYNTGFVFPTSLGILVENLVNTSTSPATPTATIAGGVGLWTAAGFALTTNAPAVVGPAITKSGTLALFMTASSFGLSNGSYPLARITAVNTDPTFTINGNAASFGPHVWHDSAQDISQVAYRAQCGHVHDIPMSAFGHNYTAPTCVWNNDGGGSGHTVGTPALATGVTSYTISSAGSGLPNGSFYWQPSGGSPTGFIALAYVTVAGGIVTNVVPLSGSPICGGEYPASPTSFTAAYGNATITCHVSNYISGIPVTNPGTGFTSLPTYTITDSTGSGAVAAPSMRLASTDVITYTVADNWLTTHLGTVFGATAATIPNFVGALEGATGHVSGFGDTPTTKFGGEYTGQNNQASFLGWAKNKMQMAGVFGGPGLVVDANYLPVSWTPGGTITCQWGGASTGLQAYPGGVYTVQYDDPQTDTTTVALNTPDFTFIDQTRVGTVVTQHWTWNRGYPPFALGELSITSSSGTMAISMPWVFAPGNTIDRSNKYAIDDALVANFTNSSGTGPGHFRFMTQIGGTGFNSMVDIADLSQLDNMFNGNNIPYNDTPPQPTYLTTIVAARFLNTNVAKSSTGDNTYPWPASTRLYSNAPWACSGTDSFGSYLDMTASALYGANDNGAIFSLGGGTQGDHGVVELRTSSPHELKTGQIVGLFSGTGKTLPWLGGGNVTISGGIATVNPFVTGPNTFAVLLGTGGPGTTRPDTINSTSEIACAFGDIQITGFTIPNSGNWTPYEFQAEMIKRWPGSKLWVTITPTMSHALVAEIASRVAAHLGPTNGVIFELGDEHWNTAPPYIQNCLYLRQLTNFVQYAPSGQPFLTYGTGGQTWFLNNGVADIANSVLSADYFNAFRTAWVAAGRDPAQLVPTYGIWWSQSGFALSVANAVATYGLPQTNAIAVGAPYITPTYSQVLKIAAYTEAGNLGISNPGNWPCDAINDFERHAMFYNYSFWQEWGLENANLASTSLRMGCYEGGVTGILDISQGAITSIGVRPVTMSSLVQEDCMNSPSWADFVYAWGLLVQRGCPTVANSGAPYASWLNLWGGGQIGGINDWYIQQSPAMPAGLGLSNSFMTPQGGFNGSNTASAIYGYSGSNQGPGFQGLLTFNAAASIPVIPPPVVIIPQRAGVLVGL